MDLARRLASVTTAGPAATVAGLPSLQPSSLGEAGAGASSNEVPECVQHISEAIRAVVPLEKLVAQAAYFKLPPWAALPSCPLHMECRREGVRMAPLPLHQFPCYLLGNSSVCDYRLEHPSISRVHCALVFHGEMQCFVVVDLRSTNGVRVDGVRIEPNKPVPLAVGSMLTVGQSNRTYEVKRGVATRDGAAGCAPEKSIAAGSSNGAAPLADARAEQNSLNRSDTVAPVSVPRALSNSSDGIARGHADSVAAPSACSSSVASLVVPVITPAPSTAESAGLVTSSTPSNADAVPSPSKHSDAVDVVFATTTTGMTQPVDANQRPPPAASPRRLRHVLVKHKDCPNVKSMNPSNKGQIVVRTLQEALRLAETIRGLHDRWTESDFSNAALQYSECSTSKSGGDLGLVHRGDFAAEFEDPCFALDNGEVSMPFVTTRGVHLVFRCPDN